MLKTTGGKIAAPSCPRRFLLFLIVLMSGDDNAAREHGDAVNAISVAAFQSGPSQAGSDFRDMAGQFLATGQGRLGVENKHALPAPNHPAVSAAALDPVNVRCIT